jgi:hypothetical protein
MILLLSDEEASVAAGLARSDDLDPEPLGLMYSSIAERAVRADDPNAAIGALVQLADRHAELVPRLAETLDGMPVAGISAALPQELAMRFKPLDPAFVPVLTRWRESGERALARSSEQVLDRL